MLAWGFELISKAENPSVVIRADLRRALVSRTPFKPGPRTPRFTA